jgi:ABC-type sugar transport system ATPase subunit
MSEGRIEQIGKALDLYYAPANLFVAGFIGSPAMNFFSGAVESADGGMARVVGAGFEPIALPTGALGRGDKVTVGVRPEHLRIAGQGPFATSGVVELVERLGESSFAHVRREDDKMLVVEVRGRETPDVSTTVTFRAPLQDVHVFDASGRQVDAAKNR